MAAEEKTTVPNVEEFLKNAQSIVATITELAETAKTAAAAANTSRDSATESQNLIATVLNDAKAKLTEITTAATQTAAAVATSRDAATESQKSIIAALNDAKAKLTEITTAATQAVVAKTKITDDQAVIATKSAHIDDAQKHADTVRADLDRQLTAAKQQATATEAQQSKAQSAAESAVKLFAEVQKNKTLVEADIATIGTAKKTAVESASLTKGLADKSATIETRVADYEKKLADLETQCAGQLKEIENLLPGATGAGLASSFNERRNPLRAFWPEPVSVFGSLSMTMPTAVHLCWVFHPACPSDRINARSRRIHLAAVPSSLRWKHVVPAASDPTVASRASASRLLRTESQVRLTNFISYRTIIVTTSFHTHALPLILTRFLRLAKISPNVARNASLVLTALLLQLLTLLFHRVANFVASDVASRIANHIANVRILQTDSA